DAFNHVNNSNFMTYREEARIRGLDCLRQAWLTDVVAPLLAAVHMSYRVPLPDPARTVVELIGNRVDNTSLTRGHRIASEDGTILYADGHVVIVWIERATGRPTPLPGAVRRIAAG